MFIDVANKSINTNSVNSIYFNKQNREIVFSMNLTVSKKQRNGMEFKESKEGGGNHQDNDLVPDVFVWYFDSVLDYNRFGNELAEILKSTGEFIFPTSPEPDRLDVINITNLAYVRYNKSANRITFNFNNSIYSKGLWISDFIHWKLSTEQYFEMEYNNIQSVLSPEISYGEIK